MVERSELIPSQNAFTRDITSGSYEGQPKMYTGDHSLALLLSFSIHQKHQ